MLWILPLLLAAAGVFFGRFLYQGLSPDAALYAGLSQKVLRTGENWRLSASEGFFPDFFEHPPFFFQWGALVLNVFGTSDGAARMIGAIPGFVAFSMLIYWLFKRMGKESAVLCLFMLLSFGHYTKYVMTSQMEAPLSLGVLLFVLGAVEFFYGALSLRLCLLMAGMGAAIAVASKGVVAFALLGAFCLSVFLLKFFRLTARSSLSIAGFFAVSLLALLFPMLLWAWKTYPTDGQEVWHFESYWAKQVFRSFTTNRDSPLHSESGSIFRYVQVILKYGWPWWWTVPAGLYLFYRRRIRLHLMHPVFTTYIVVALCTFLSIFLPFSLSTFQLPHYIHPTYLVLAPIGAFFVRELLSVPVMKALLNRRFHWALFVLVSVLMPMFFNGTSRSSNRGQEFAAVAPELRAFDPSCRLVLDEKAIDPYRMEAFALWYFEARSWEFRQGLLSTPRNKEIIWRFPSSLDASDDCASR